MTTVKNKSITVAWIYNGKSYVEEFDNATLAFLRMFQLQAYGMEPTIHGK